MLFLGKKSQKKATYLVVNKPTNFKDQEENGEEEMEKEKWRRKMKTRRKKEKKEVSSAETSEETMASPCPCHLSAFSRNVEEWLVQLHHGLPPSSGTCRTTNSRCLFRPYLPGFESAVLSFIGNDGHREVCERWIKIPKVCH